MLALLTKFGFGGAMKWLSSPTGRVVVALVLLGAWTVYQRADAAHDAREAVWAEVEEEYDRQRAEAEKLRQEARERADEVEEELTRLEELQNDFVNDPANESCDIPDDVRQRLLEIQ